MVFSQLIEIKISSVFLNDVLTTYWNQNIKCVLMKPTPYHYKSMLHHILMTFSGVTYPNQCSVISLSAFVISCLLSAIYIINPWSKTNTEVISYVHDKWKGGSLAEWLGRRTWNPEVEASPAPTTKMKLFLDRHKFSFSWQLEFLSLLRLADIFVSFRLNGIPVS